LVVIVPELGDVERPGEAMTSCSKVHWVAPLAPRAGEADMAGTDRSSRVMASSIRLETTDVSLLSLNNKARTIGGAWGRCTT
jgi:hypothetical protein